MCKSAPDDLWRLTTKRPDGQIAEQVKNAQETLGYQKIIVPKIPPGGGGLLPAQSLSRPGCKFVYKSSVFQFKSLDPYISNLYT